MAPKHKLQQEVNHSSELAMLIDGLKAGVSTILERQNVTCDINMWLGVIEESRQTEALPRTVATQEPQQTYGSA